MFIVINTYITNWFLFFSWLYAHPLLFYRTFNVEYRIQVINDVNVVTSLKPFYFR